MGRTRFDGDGPKAPVPVYMGPPAGGPTVSPTPWSSGAPSRSAALLAAGLVGALLVLGLPASALASLPVRLGVDLLLAAGLYGVLERVLEGAGPRGADALVPALAPALVAPVALRVLAPHLGIRLSAPLAASLWFEVTSVGAAAATWRLVGADGGSPRPDLAVALAGLAAPVAVLGVHLAARPPRPPSTLVAGGALGGAVLAGLAQRRWAGGLPGRLGVLGRRGPATVTGAQLLDGLVTAFAIATPLGFVEPRFGEGNPVTRVLLDAMGPWFVLLKLAAALVTGLVLEASFERADGDPWQGAARVGTYLLVLRFSLGPGVFSSLQLLL